MGCRCFLVFMVMLVATTATAQKDSTTRMKEVEIRDTKSGNFGSLRQVDGMKLTAGKKSEVIDVEQLTVNKATNNTRQVYAKVAGLNIFENDGSGLQLSIGGRGLDPNRTSNFNVRQNGYDISADALGYPESYYTPPADALHRIEIIKGAASLQYGTQFGGLLNFEMKQPGNSKAISVESKQTAGSFGFLGSYNAISGTKGKLSYYGYLHYKRGDGWRPNSNFESFNGYLDVHYRVNDKHMLGIEYTHLNYLAKQPGGLDSVMFAKDPRQSNRPRNWFAVNWNLMDVEWDYQISPRTRLQTRINGLIATRDAIGFRPNRPSQPDNGGARDLLKGEFKNVTFESRFLHRYEIAGMTQNLLVGIRAYKGHGMSVQGDANNGSGADFNFDSETSELKSDYEFPNLNYAAFAEQIVRITDKWNITPGIRVEYIRTAAHGVYHNRERDLRDSVISHNIIKEDRELPRTFVIGGIGSSYKPFTNLEFYGNISQNYRSVTYNDMQVVNASFKIDTNLKDETGWSADLGVRGNVKNLFRFDVSGFQLYYDNRIGEVGIKGPNSRALRMRGNIGTARIYGLESFLELDVLKLWNVNPDKWGVTVYSNLALTESEYLNSRIPGVTGREVEYVPGVNWKAGLQTSFRQFKLTCQFSYLSKQYTEATNTNVNDFTAVNGPVPAYKLMDISAGWSYRWLLLEASMNNVANVSYYTRRATGYPGPGIIPGDGRSYYLTVGVKF